MSIASDIDIETPVVTSQRGSPTWEIAHLYPRQGDWTEEQYLALSTNRLVEFKDGCLEFLTMPTLLHQFIVQFLYEQLEAFRKAAQVGGRAFVAAVPIRLRPGLRREPDVFYLSAARLARSKDYPEGADLVMEVVSKGPEDRERDYDKKREDYAAAGIPEYWIVDPQEQRIHVLTLQEDIYREHGVFGPGQTASSVLLNGFSVSVDACFAPGQELNRKDVSGS